MENFEEKLNHLLNDEAAMGQIMSLARSISGGGGQDRQTESQDADWQPVEPEKTETVAVDAPAQDDKEESAPDWEAVLGMLSSLSGGQSGDALSSGGSLLKDVDPKLLQLGMRVLSEYNRQDDSKAALLNALRPFVREKRYAKIDQAIRIARLSRVIRVAIDALKESRQGERIEGA